MKLQERRAISPIIAALLLIAIAVGAGIIVYVFVTGLAGNLTGSGGTQVTQQLQLQAYTFTPVGSSGTGKIVDFFIKNVGSSSLTISSVYFDGTQLVEWGAGTYTRYLLVPNSAQNCFAAVPTTATVVANTAATGATVTGTASACTTTGATCTATNFCLDFTSAQTQTVTLSAQSAGQIFVGLNTAQTAGSGHTLKIVTSTGGQYVFSVIVGRNG